MLSEAVLLRRLEAFQQTRSFFIEMWLQNPAMAQHAGERVVQLLAPLPDTLAALEPPT